MSRASIFIVEDSVIVSLHLQKTLESEGYHVVGTADSGRKALKCIAEKRPDLVLMDIMLNGDLDGIETATLLKDNYHVPVVYITALTDPGTIHRAKITEPYGYLTKPFEDHEIFTVIELALYKFETETKLKRSEEKFFSTLKSISDGVMAIDRAGLISYVNPSAESMMGCEDKSCIGKYIQEFFLLRDSVTGEYPVNPLQCAINNQNSNVLPDGLLLVSSSGKEIPIGECSINRLIDYKGNFNGLVITFKDVSDRIERDKLLELSERKRLAAQLEGQENERKRIARDLHDGLGQMLNAIKMNINTITNHPEKSDDLNRLLDEAINETKRISENLLPSKVRDFGIETNLRSLCQEMQLLIGISIEFNKLGDIPKLDDVLKINLYRIAQEAITNAVRHAHANHIVVQLSEDRNWIILTIEDDGRGFKHKEAREANKNGLLNMRDRARVLNGNFSVESDIDRGTLIMIQIPLQSSLESSIVSHKSHEEI